MFRDIRREMWLEGPEWGKHEGGPPLFLQLTDSCRWGSVLFPQSWVASEGLGNSWPCPGSRGKSTYKRKGMPSFLPLPLKLISYNPMIVWANESSHLTPMKRRKHRGGERRWMWLHVAPFCAELEIRDEGGWVPLHVDWLGLVKMSPNPREWCSHSLCFSLWPNLILNTSFSWCQMWTHLIGPFLLMWPH